MKKMPDAEHAAVVEHAAEFLAKMKDGIIISFIAIGMDANGDTTHILAACDPVWARKALNEVLAKLPQEQPEPIPAPPNAYQH